MPVLPNPFNKEPILPLDRTDPEANALIVRAMLGKKWEAKQRALNAGKVGKPRPKHRTQAEIEAEARANVAAAKATREKAQANLIKEAILADVASYKAKGLTEWSAEVETLITRWNELPQSERDYLIKKRKEGYLIIGMPSSQTQLATISPAIRKLIPIYTNPDTKKREPANPTDIWWDHAKELINNQDTSLIPNTPNHPYFLVVEPTERPAACNKPVNGPDGQIEWIAEQHTKDPYVFCINLLEYITLQVRNTENGKEPIDAKTWIRLVDVSQHDGNVLYADWGPDSDNRQLEVGRNDVYASSYAGVRLSGRI